MCVSVCVYVHVSNKYRVKMIEYQLCRWEYVRTVDFELLTLHSLHSIDSQMTFIWIPGHIGFPEHDAFDKAAKQTTSFPKITDYTLSLIHISEPTRPY